MLSWVSNLAMFLIGFNWNRSCQFCEFRIELWFWVTILNKTEPKNLSDVLVSDSDIIFFISFFGNSYFHQSRFTLMIWKIYLMKLCFRSTPWLRTAALRRYECFALLCSLQWTQSMHIFVYLFNLLSERNVLITQWGEQANHILDEWSFKP